MTFKLVEARINLAIIELLGAFADRFEQERLGIKLWIDTKNIQNNARRSTVIPTTDDVAVTNDEQEFALVVVIKRC